jgi:hypothetical protein
MKDQYWFKAHKSGYGWHPSTWQGWLVIVLYLGFLIHSFIQVDSHSHSNSDTLIGFLPRFLIFTALLTILTYLKGESITWGEKGKEQHKIP